MPSLRVVSGSSLLVVGMMSALAFAEDPSLMIADAGVFIPAGKITAPIGAETVQNALPATALLADVGFNKTSSVIDALAMMETPRDVKAEADSQARATEMRAAAASPAKVVLTQNQNQNASSENSNVSPTGSGASFGSVRLAGASPITLSVIGATALAIAGCTAAIIARSRKHAH